jgi:hypothetical protein
VPFSSGGGDGDVRVAVHSRLTVDWELVPAGRLRPSCARRLACRMSHVGLAGLRGVAATKRNGARWSVALALGIRQGEALGLRWSYVDLETGVIRAWFQIQRVGWQHGCGDPHACGEQWHRQPCKSKCKKHRHLPTCKPGCTRKGHVCFKRSCSADCMGHADKCPCRVGGGIVFRQRKGKSKLTLQCPPALLELLREHRKRQAVERLRAGDLWADHDLVFATRRGGPSNVPRIGGPGRLSSARRRSGMPGSTMPCIQPPPC